MKSSVCHPFLGGKLALTCVECVYVSLSRDGSLPPTREQQQQARRLAEAGTKEVERIKEALEPRKPPVETKPRPRDARKAWVRAGLRDLRGW